jgi:glycine/betaine/sarcosine/D-proline reductase family selenoprotein B
VLAKEIERAGIATVFVTSLPTIGTMVGANRIVRGPAITHPFGLAEEERRRIVERALDMLETDVEPTTVWEVEQVLT